MTSALDGFRAVTREWFAGAFDAPTAAQEQTWAAIAAGHHVLTVAPTGSGKTLAAFLSAIDQLAAEGPPEDPTRRCRVVYVSPLKALAVDVDRNLRSPLAGVRASAGRLGLPAPDIRVGTRTGDTPAADRRAFAKHPPDILITTPESLFLLLTSAARESLRGVETVIVDEVHAVCATKRGVHLALTLERLDALLERPARRVGLSATVRPVEEVARFLGGAAPVRIVQPPAAKTIEVSVVVPVEDMTNLGGSEEPGEPGAEPAEEVMTKSLWPAIEERVFGLIGDHTSTIVFANGRRGTERLTAKLNELGHELATGEPPAVGDQFPAQMIAESGIGHPTATDGAGVVAMAHHGSVSKEQRSRVEEALKSGQLPAVVATSSLELGIDMGAVDLVVQIAAPPSVASGMQRIGRAGHQVGAISRGVILPNHRGDLVPCAVVAERMSAGAIEELTYPRNALDVLAQQIVAMVALEPWTVDQIEEVVRRAAPYASLPRSALEAVLDMLAGRYPSDAFAELRPRLTWDRDTGVLAGRSGSQRLAVTSGGTIPDRGLFGVFLAGEDTGQRSARRRVGELDEEMVYESRVGDLFLLGSSAWRITDITPDQVNVVPAPGQPARMPFWKADIPGRPLELGRAIGAFRRELAQASEEAARERVSTAGLDQNATENLLRYLAEQTQSTRVLPDDRTVVVERFRDELGDWRICVHTPFGDRVHSPWALALTARLRERYGVDAQAVHSDDGIVLRLPDMDDVPPADVAVFDPDEIEEIVTAELTGSAVFASRFRECAARALLLPRRQPGRRAPLWQQRQRSAQLLAVAGEYGEFPIVLEAMRECLHDVFDVPGLVQLMRELSTRQARVVEVETAVPSPFARSLLFGYVDSFMYEGDNPIAEQRAQALTVDTTLLAELLGRADLRELLDPDVLAETEAQLQRLAPDRRARDLDSVADLLRVLGGLSTQEALERGATEEWLAELVTARRAIEVRIAGEPRWIAIEDAGRVRDALGVALPAGVPTAFTEQVRDPVGDLISRYARTHGPFTAADCAARLGMGTAVVSGALERLAGAGRVVAGEFRPDHHGAEWCDVEVLRTLRRRSLAALRKEAEPVPVTALAEFLPAWQGVRPSTINTSTINTSTNNAGHSPSAGANAEHSGRVGTAARPARASTGPEELLEVLDTLQGIAIPASALERQVLPARLNDYWPAHLDELTSAGEVIWTGCGSLPGNDGWIALAYADQAGLLLPETRPVSTSSEQSAVDSSRGNGALVNLEMIGGDSGPADSSASDGVAPGGLAAAVLSVLDGGGAMFFRAISDAVADTIGSTVDDEELIAALWDLVWAGRLTNDTLGPLRALLTAGRSPSRGGRGSSGTAATAMRSRIQSRRGRPWPKLPPSPLASSPLSSSPLPENRLPQRGVSQRRGSQGRPRLPSRTGPPTVAGRWSLVPAREPDPTLRAHAAVDAMLERYGILTRGTVAAERSGGFATLYPVLSGWEEAGRVRRGYFVTGLGGAQFALSGAVDRLRRIAADIDRRTDSTAPTALVLAATDPANPYGAALDWPAAPADSTNPARSTNPAPSADSADSAARADFAASTNSSSVSESRAGRAHRPGRKAGALVVLVDGELVLYVERGGRTLLSFTADGQRLAGAANALAASVTEGRLDGLSVERANGAPITTDSPLATALWNAGFKATPRGLRIRA